MSSASTDDTLRVPQGTFTVLRHGTVRDAGLRAWDAADEYALAELAERSSGATGRCLVVDDGSGAVAVALAASGADVALWTDSHVTELALAGNLERNHLAADAVAVVPSTETPGGTFDTVVVKVPRTKAYLDDVLRRLRPHLAAGATVIGAGMTKAVHRSTIDSFETHLGPTPTSLARKKARLLLPALDAPDGDAVDPRPAIQEWVTPGGLTVTGMPNVFSAGALDAGTRLLLAHVPDLSAVEVAVDLGCGNGVIAATLAARRAGLHVVCCDESHQAVAAARETVGRVTGAAEFHVTDVLDGIDDASADLVVVNPPFHAGGARTTTVARRMFVEARRVLRPGGSVIVVGNRHLGHHVHLKRIFAAAVETVASDSKFVVLAARRS